jgi:hypothetical protein
MLVATFAAAVLVLAYPILVGFTASVRHLVLLAPTAGVLACTCYVVTEIMQPYRGWIKVEPDALVPHSEQLRRSP